jgi:hypothetical protein
MTQLNGANIAVRNDSAKSALRLVIASVRLSAAGKTETMCTQIEGKCRFALSDCAFLQFVMQRLPNGWRSLPLKQSRLIHSRDRSRHVNKVQACQMQMVCCSQLIRMDVAVTDSDGRNAKRQMCLPEFETTSRRAHDGSIAGDIKCSICLSRSSVTSQAFCHHIRLK